MRRPAVQFRPWALDKKGNSGNRYAGGGDFAVAGRRSPPEGRRGPLMGGKKLSAPRSGFLRFKSVTKFLEMTLNLFLNLLSLYIGILWRVLSDLPNKVLKG